MNNFVLLWVRDIIIVYDGKKFLNFRKVLKFILMHLSIIYAINNSLTSYPFSNVSNGNSLRCRITLNAKLSFNLPIPPSSWLAFRLALLCREKRDWNADLTIDKIKQKELTFYFKFSFVYTFCRFRFHSTNHIFSYNNQIFETNF